MGDFSEVLAPKERKGGRVCVSNMEDFGEWIQEMNMIDLPLIRRKYNWVRGNSYSGLDRVFVDGEWFSHFLALKLWALDHSLFDHSLLLVEPKKID